MTAPAPQSSIHLIFTNPTNPKGKNPTMETPKTQDEKLAQIEAFIAAAVTPREYEQTEATECLEGLADQLNIETEKVGAALCALGDIMCFTKDQRLDDSTFSGIGLLLDLVGMRMIGVSSDAMTTLRGLRPRPTIHAPRRRD